MCSSDLFRLERAQNELHIQEGLMKALNVIDEVIAAIRASDDRADARTRLQADPFAFSETQAEHILDMTLGRLTKLARIDIETRIAGLQTDIASYNTILADPVVLRGVIKDDLRAIKEEFATPRVCEITLDAGDMDLADQIGRAHV